MLKESLRIFVQSAIIYYWLLCVHCTMNTGIDLILESQAQAQGIMAKPPSVRGMELPDVRKRY